MVICSSKSISLSSKTALLLLVPSGSGSGLFKFCGCCTSALLKPKVDDVKSESFNKIATSKLSAKQMVVKSAALSGKNGDGQNFTTVYIDGCSALSHSPAETRGGVGVFFGHNDPRNVSEPLIGGAQGNSFVLRAELVAVCRALEIVRAYEINSNIRVVTDNTHLKTYATQGLPVWKAKGWKMKPKHVKYLEDLKRLDNLLDGINVTFQCVNPKSAVEGKIEADKLAYKAAKMHSVPIISSVQKAKEIEEQVEDNCLRMVNMTTDVEPRTKTSSKCSMEAAKQTTGETSVKSSEAQKTVVVGTTALKNLNEQVAITPRSRRKGSLARGGTGVIFGHNDPRNVFETLSGKKLRDKLEAVCRALETVRAFKNRSNIRVTTDSKWLIRLTTVNIPKWKLNDWDVKSEPRKRCLEDLKRLAHLLEETNVKFEYVPGNLEVEKTQLHTLSQCEVPSPAGKCGEYKGGKGLPQEPDAMSKLTKEQRKALKKAQRKALKKPQKLSLKLAKKAENSIKPTVLALQPDTSCNADDGLNYTTVYTDGSCLSSHDPACARGGVGVFFGHNDPRNVSEPLSGMQDSSRAELVAVCRALETARAVKNDSNIRIITDSQWVIELATNQIRKWKLNGWVMKNKLRTRYVGYVEDFKRLASLLEGITVKFEYVRGHSGVEGNVQADELADKGAKMHAVAHKKGKKGKKMPKLKCVKKKLKPLVKTSSTLVIKPSQPKKLVKTDASSKPCGHDLADEIRKNTDECTISSSTEMLSEVAECYNLETTLPVVDAQTSVEVPVVAPVVSHNDQCPKVYVHGWSAKLGPSTSWNGMALFWGPNDPRNCCESLVGNGQSLEETVVIAACLALDTARASGAKSIRILSDCKFLTNTVIFSMPLWKKNGWRTSRKAKGVDIPYRKNFERLDELLQGMDVTWERVSQQN